MSLEHLLDSESARKLAQDSVADERFVSLADMSTALSKQALSLNKLDSHIKLELTWIEESCEALTHIINNAIMARLPTHSMRIDVDKAHTDLLALRQ